LITINEDTDVLLGTSSRSRTEKMNEAEHIKFFETFIIGQGSIYVLGTHNKENKNGKIVNNGPKYLERQWNPRALNTKAVQQLISSTGDGLLLYNQFQEHALTMGVSGKLMHGVDCAAYQSNDFPPLAFATDPKGELSILNGHHRIEADKKIHAAELDQLAEYQKVLKGFEIASDNDTSEIIEAREKATALKLQLWKGGLWATILVDTGELISIIQQTIE